MLIQKTNPAGIDYSLQLLQTELHNALMTAWGLDINTAADNKLFECYGRCYRNKKDTGYVAEVYTGSNQYKEVYWNNSLYAISFFGTSDKVDLKNNNKTDAHLVFFVDLKKLALEDTAGAVAAHRTDEEVHNQVQGIIRKSLYGVVLNSIETGLVNVLREYNGSYRDDRLKAVDMHPVHCFRLNFSLEYDINNYCKPFKNF